MSPGTSCAACGHPTGVTGERGCDCPPAGREDAGAAEARHRSAEPSGPGPSGPGHGGAAQEGTAEEAAPIRPLLPPNQGPSPGDLAMFSDTARLPLVREEDAHRPGAYPPPHDTPAEQAPLPPAAAALDVTPPEGTDTKARRSRRKPRHRRSSYLAGTAVAVVVGCTAVVTSVLGGRTAEDTAYHDVDPAPEFDLAPDDAPPAPEGEEQPESDAETTEEPAPQDGVPDETADGTTGPEPSAPPVDREAEGPAGDGTPDRSRPRQESGSVGVAPPPSSGEDSPPPPVDTAPEEVVRGPNALLGPGDEGAEVRALQEQLNAVGDHFAVPVTGVYDQATFESVARFQEWYGVWQREVRGVYCTVTDERMEAFFAE
ncbi:peptidoglycan-binding protein [Streptomyces lonarensis]|uniref:Peptidoglycan binding-like domain-containing protein n=1 Tax=Streptomyces lonarensis TaxID=700599 RepID=A0A7X6D0M4_9ACTN|nr:peptidoglycan-binding protein [Streptomyces lonarensis]NJQ06009.1 hypothetical protein [Streptomyces lonarensis]